MPGTGTPVDLHTGSVQVLQVLLWIFDSLGCSPICIQEIRGSADWQSGYWSLLFCSPTFLFTFLVTVNELCTHPDSKLRCLSWSPNPLVHNDMPAWRNHWLRMDSNVFYLTSKQYGVELISQSSFCQHGNMASQGVLVMFSVALIRLQANPTREVHLQQAAITQPAAAALSCVFCTAVVLKAYRQWMHLELMETDLVCVTSRQRGKTGRWCSCIVQFWC